MSNQYVGEIRIVPFNFAPLDWALCNGQLLSISQNTALFSLLGTNFGGDGRSNFALPNLMGSAPIDPGQGPGLSLYNIGEVGGVSQVTLLQSEMPAHTHSVFGYAGNGDFDTPSGKAWAMSHLGKTPINIYNATGGGGLTMNQFAFGLTGGNQPHNNMPPFLTLNFIIALTGVFPPHP